MSRQLAEILLKDRIITQAQFEEAAKQSKTGLSFIRYLIDKKHVAETKLLYYLGQKYNLSSINLAKFDVSEDVVRLISPDQAKKNQVIPIQIDSNNVVVAVCDPTNTQVIQSLRFILKKNIEVVLTSYSAFDAAMSKYYAGVANVGAAIDSFQKDLKGKKDLEETGMAMDVVQVHEIDNQSAVQDGPVIAIVNGILSEGIRRRASDIHVEPYEKRFRVRVRCDGVLQEIAEIPPEMRRSVIARFKIMSRMDISEARVPQDGRIKLKSGGSDVDFRVSSLPTLFGEKIVLRMLSKGNLQLDLAKLGFEPKQLEIFHKGIEAPNGMVLVTGPTGSGKTTTLYSALSELNKVTENLSTAEDPVEYNLEGINQVQVHKEIGLTFANVLRSLLRQDPDVILVGEIRDYETAEVSIQAALTGHLVLSTLHTNDAASTITRLMNMGIEPFLVVASLNTIVAQRLIRTLCESCKVDEVVPKERLLALGIPPEQVETFKPKKGKGCKNCMGMGYRGRVAIYEVLDFTQTLKQMVLAGENIIDIKKQAVKDGMRTLRQSALTKAMEGRTSLEEAVTLTMEN